MAINALPPSVMPGQRQAVPFLYRYLLPFMNPSWLDATGWRSVVRRQQIALICRDAIVDNIVSSPWRIVPRDLDLTGSLDEEVKYYTDLLDDGDGGWDVHMELVLQDALDTPAGGTAEVVRENDVPEGRALWFKHMDAATIYPTYNDDFPIVQKADMTPGIVVWFPKHAVSRMGYTPRPEMLRKGWFMAPPEKVFLGLEMLSRGDQYYAKMLLDTPEAGVLDLGDMSQQAAEDWLGGWRTLMNGIDPFKIPVLYEHTIPAKFLSFGRPPTDIIFDKTTLKYAAFCAAGYGLSLPDIGIVVEGTGQSLAGQIRSERRSAKTGLGITRVKVVKYWNRILPKTLKFEFVERDDEMLVSKGRARLANSMAMRNLTEGGIVDPNDAQEQLVADGLLTVPMNPAPQGSATAKIIAPRHVADKLLGSPVPPSKGGQGEVVVKSSYVRRALNVAAKALKPLTTQMLENPDSEATAEWLLDFENWLLGEDSGFDADPILKAQAVVASDLSKQGWWITDQSMINDLVSEFTQDILDLVKEEAFVQGLDVKSLSVGAPDIDQIVSDEDGITLNVIARSAVLCTMANLISGEDLTETFASKVRGRLEEVPEELKSQIQRAIASSIKLED